MTEKKDITHYKELNFKEFNDVYQKIISTWDDFIKLESPGLIEGKDYFVHQRNIHEVIRRVDKRRVYYGVFHDLKDACEYKMVGILCFWINTLKPFMVVNPDSPIYNSPNEMFSVYLILCCLRQIYKNKFDGKEFEYPSQKRIGEIVYDFKYCHLNREATINFIETFADSYQIGMDYIRSLQAN